nr:PH domain-containing protein [Phytoactinopolyspora halophila]
MTADLPKYDDYRPAEQADELADGASASAGAADPTPWQRLHVRMIWVDAIWTILSLAPSAIAIWVVGVEPTLGNLWPVIAIAVFGVMGAVTDALRWVFTRYRVTNEYVERRTGVFVRRYRSVRRDRIRSVDSTAKLRHRLARLRVVSIGAGQQAAAGESALALDAVTKDDAEGLRRELLSAAGSETEPRAHDDEEPDKQVFARLRPHWVVYNVFNVWAYVMAAGLLWGGFWLASTFGIDVVGFLDALADWEALGWGWTITIAVLVTGALGVVGLAVNFFTEYWNFELARVPGERGTLLRTRRGLFQTREVNRDDTRMRGVEISEPVLWRWMGMADTNVITTGLDRWSISQPATILPRGPIGVARPVAAAVLGRHPGPLDAPLERHPRAALHRRMWWGDVHERCRRRRARMAGRHRCVAVVDDLGGIGHLATHPLLRLDRLPRPGPCDRRRVRRRPFRPDDADERGAEAQGSEHDRGARVDPATAPGPEDRVCDDGGRLGCL